MFLGDYRQPTIPARVVNRVLNFGAVAAMQPIPASEGTYHEIIGFSCYRFRTHSAVRRYLFHEFAPAAPSKPAGNDENPAFEPDRWCRPCQRQTRSERLEWRVVRSTYNFGDNRQQILAFFIIDDAVFENLPNTVKNYIDRPDDGRLLVHQKPLREFLDFTRGHNVIGYDPAKQAYHFIRLPANSQG
ncbi:MAG TPA: hypothetical protein VN442_12540 [Bryobacteraceae bacterium]|nr:hypothetical protein [Bryobacteraceae bacterium]